MREYVLSDKQVIRFTEKQHKMLLRRFDVRRAKDSKRGYEIKEECICNTFGGDCMLCPIGKCINCNVLMSRIMGIGWVLGLFHYTVYCIWWGKDDDEKVRVLLSKVYKALLSMKKI